MSDNVQLIDQYLIFSLNEDLFAMNVSRIREVIDLEKIVKIPRTPAFVAGIINLRGKVVPVIDLKGKLELGTTQGTRDTSIIITELHYEGQILLIGGLVDSVRSVVRFEASVMEPPPRVGLSVDLTFIESIARYKESFVMVLNPDRIFSDQELNFLSGNLEGSQTEDSVAPEQ
jgi:purine-binding chemotaxis protein CheW